MPPATALVLDSRSGVGDGSQLIVPTLTSGRRTKALTEMAATSNAFPVEWGESQTDGDQLWFALCIA
jgi:hypothetical protein